MTTGTQLSLLLVCIFFPQWAVGGPKLVQLDLFDSLHLHNQTYQGVTLGKGIHKLSPGVIFTGDYREIMVSSDWVDRIRAQVSEIGVNDFTISAIIKQNPNNVGTILAFSKGLLSALEIQSSGRKNELRVISGSLVETFPFRLADGSWHRLAITFSASQVDILVDCMPVSRRVLKFDPATAIFNSLNISIWIGQKTTSHFLYQGAMQDLQLILGPYGYLSQCPQVDTQCPTCSEYTALKMSFASLQSQIQMLTERLNRAEARLSDVEQCECQKSCRVNDTSVFGDGSSWHQNCDICTCKKGEILCQPVQCPQAKTCKNPISKPGECCPTCLKQCYFRGETYDHGETTSIKECTQCKCNDGSMQCTKDDPEKKCPPLTCPLKDQVIVPGECCKVCLGTDYCASHGHLCHSNATCLNLQTTYTCQCKGGFTGDGVEMCMDIDECLSERHHCARNSKCVNTMGGYKCECASGYKKVNQFQCEDENECAVNGSNKCHSHSTCTNTKGSYMCTCNPGYSGNGVQCTPICNQTCENGGICIAPDVCSCRAGWDGVKCETDIDECFQERNSSLETGALCPANALCVNKPGWYLCQCMDGFQASLTQSGEAQCIDINECSEDDACPVGLECVNTVGSYECRCSSADHHCSSGCWNEGRLHPSGSNWFRQDCSICNCESTDNISCSSYSEDLCSQICSTSPLNMTDENPLHKCCTKCATPNSTTVVAPSIPNLKTCQHQLYQNVHFKSGEMWHFQCQTCECQHGEIDCWPIDCPPVDCHDAFLPAGDCCFRCPEESANDKCTHWHRNSTFSQCHLLQNTIESGTRVTLPHNNCLSCKCQYGNLCCNYDYDCVARSSRPSVVTAPTH
ncbi:unnamed protein product [Orchesella dallaii]|uniref:Protein kinase C-binding protein NELL2 n=1 Tax=Orchesella dallaii TaxID=48710 RepID=A0ABP1QYU9_9HEXA